MGWLPEGSHGLPEPHEMHGTATVKFSDAALTADVRLKTPWEERYDVLNAMLLAPVEWPYLPGSGIYAASGQIDPFPGDPGQSVEGEPGLLAYEHALLSVHFETLTISTGGGGTVDIFSESIEPTAEFLSIPHAGFRWGSGTGEKVKPEEAPGKLIPGLDWKITLYKLSSIPAHVLTLPGHVNSSTVFSPTLGLSFPAETLLYNPPLISRTVSLGGGDPRYTMSLRLTCRPTGWNKYWRAEKMPTPGWDEMFPEGTDTDPYKNYPLGDFSSVLPVVEGS